jgi:hypothetical protein
MTPPSSLIGGRTGRPAPAPAGPVVGVAAVVASGCALAMLLGPPSGTDLPAQQFRAAFASAHPLAAIDLRWLGGVKPAAYSVIAPYVEAGLGVRLTGALAAVAAAVLLAVLLVRWRAPRAGWAAAWAAVGFVANVVDGRVAFALGLTVGLAALAAVPEGRASRRRWALPLVLALGCPLTSPVAALFLALVALGWALRRRAVGLLAVAALLPLGAIAVVFPEPGRMPDTWSDARPDLIAAVAIAVVCRGLVVRSVAAVYAIAVLVVYLDPGPIGSNIERLALLATAPVLICCARLPRTVLLAGLVLVGWWTAKVPLNDLHHAHTLAAERASAARLVDVLHGLGPVTGRVEVVPFLDHGESATVAAAWPLARGWERQVDVSRNSVLYDGTLTAARYHDWLREHAVQYVALGRGPHDFGAQHELSLLAHPPSYLVPVHVDAQWTVWRVIGSQGIVSAPGRLVAVTADSLRLSRPTPGEVTVTVQPSHWWRVSGGGCIVGSAGDRIVVRLPGATTVTLSSSYLHPAGGPRCPG